jgi:hypothetical protein
MDIGLRTTRGRVGVWTLQLRLTDLLRILLFGAIVAGPALAGEVRCGEVITGTAVLTSDLVCGDANPALTIDGGELDMAGHQISGGPAYGVGVRLIGRGAGLHNGVVRACGHAVELAGDGGHSITNVVARGNAGDGFVVASRGNLLLRNLAIGNRGSGFRTAAAVVADTLLLGNASKENGDQGATSVLVLAGAPSRPVRGAGLD